MIFKRIIESKTVYVEASEEFSKEAEQLLDLVENSELEWKDEAILSFHYAHIQLKAIEDGFEIYVPDLENKNPKDYIKDVSYLLSIFRKTFEAAKRTKQIGKLINYTHLQDVILANEVLGQSEWYAHRYEEDTWFIGHVDPTLSQQPLQGKFAYEVFPDFPDLYYVMHLPLDTIALFSKGQLVSILDENGVDIWNQV